MEKTVDHSKKWLSAEKYLKYFGFFVIGSIVTGLILTYLPDIRGYRWSTCHSGGSIIACRIIFYIWGVPIIGFSAFYAWYYFKNYSRENAHQINLLLIMTNVVNIVYLTFQSSLLLDSIRRAAPSWETIIMSGIAVLLLIGISLGILTNYKLTRVLNPY
jgi:hypothetical protein